MPFPLRTAAAVTALGLAGAAIWTFSNGSNADPDQETVTLGRIANIALTTEHDCTDLLAYYRTEAARVVGPYGLDGGPQIYYAREMASRSDAVLKGAPPVAAGAAAGAGSGAEDSGTPDTGTNVQVAGVDESDIVKTDGDLMVSVIEGEIRITRLAGAKTKTLATWRPVDGSAQSILLDGDTAVVIGDRNGGIPLGAMTKRAPGPEIYSPAVTDLTILDLADPAHPRPVRRLELGGTRSGEARLVDGEIRLALTAGPTGITWKQPVYADVPEGSDQSRAKYEKSEKEATTANKRLIAKSTIDNWIPQATVTPLDAKGKPAGPPVSRPLLDCEQVAIPGSFSGLRTLALVSMDLRAETPLTTWRAAGVIADGSTVYATADHVWLATSRWNAISADGPTSLMSRFAPSAASTQIHRFDTPLRAQPTYVASGEVPGSLLSQFSMDEKDGMLRVASTTEPSPDEPVEPQTDDSSVSDSIPSVPSNGTSSSGTGGGVTGSQGSAGPTTVVGPTTAVDPTTAVEPTPAATPKAQKTQKTQKTQKKSEGQVAVLKVEGKRLVQVGVVTGLGVGERIRGVRFIGDVGYVITYRQTDPLYTVDLSDPARPRVRGELAVLGYSAYLHPAGDGRLLGLGQDGTKDGRVTGLQLSLFDVANLESPRRLDRTRLAGAYSDAEDNHHAFTMAGDLVLIPYNSWTSAEVKKSPGEAESLEGNFVDRFDAGVIAVRVGADGLGTPSTLRPIADGPITFDSSRELPQSIRRTTDATPMRTVVRDGTIYTLTSTGVAVHSAATFDRQTFSRFAN